MTVPYMMLAPLIALAVTAVLLLTLSALAPRQRVVAAVLTVVGLLAACGLILWGWREARTVFGGTVTVDALAVAFGLLGIATVIVTVLLSLPYGTTERWESGDYEALLLFAAGGMLVLAVASDLLVLLIGIELLALPLYLLAGFPRGRETALRYFLLGVVALAIQAYGTALVYGAVGSTTFSAIAAVATTGNGTLPLLLVGLALVLTGLGFKLALAPFHQWAPDAYSGAPTPVLVILAVGTKVAVIAAFVRLLYSAVPGLQSYWGPIVTAVALVTVLVGSVGVLLQREMGRLIAYSGIAQIGLVALALATGSGAGARAAFLGLVAYAAATGALVTVLGIVHRGGSDSRTLPALGGLMTRHPGIAAALILALLSLGGIPPTAGFAGKLALLTAALNGVNAWVVFVAALASVATVAAYVRVFLATIRMPAEEPTASVEASPLLLGTLLAVTLVTIIAGVAPWVIGWSGKLLGGGGF
ncbi:MAG: NADH-quinone oxidoreductase subunit N [Thermomicrobiales bacterium]